MLKILQIYAVMALVIAVATIDSDMKAPMRVVSAIGWPATVIASVEIVSEMEKEVQDDD